jgi:hypothetical protein
MQMPCWLLWLPGLQVRPVEVVGAECGRFGLKVVVVGVGIGSVIGFACAVPASANNTADTARAAAAAPNPVLISFFLLLWVLFMMCS